MTEKIKRRTKRRRKTKPLYQYVRVSRVHNKAWAAFCNAIAEIVGVHAPIVKHIIELYHAELVRSLGQTGHALMPGFASLYMEVLNGNWKYNPNTREVFWKEPDGQIIVRPLPELRAQQDMLNAVLQTDLALARKFSPKLLAGRPDWGKMATYPTEPASEAKREAMLAFDAANPPPPKKVSANRPRMNFFKNRKLPKLATSEGA